MDTGNYLLDDFKLPTLTSETALFEIFSDSSVAKNVSLTKHTFIIQTTRV